jgi:hypothetical protein
MKWVGSSPEERSHAWQSTGMPYGLNKFLERIFSGLPLTVSSLQAGAVLYPSVSPRSWEPTIVDGAH